MIADEEELPTDLGPAAGVVLERLQSIERASELESENDLLRRSPAARAC